jgi:hypothetical protein
MVASGDHPLSRKKRVSVCANPLLSYRQGRRTLSSDLLVKCKAPCRSFAVALFSLLRRQASIYLSPDPLDLCFRKIFLLWTFISPLLVGKTTCTVHRATPSIYRGSANCKPMTQTSICQGGQNASRCLFGCVDRHHLKDGSSKPGFRHRVGKKKAKDFPAEYGFESISR